MDNKSLVEFDFVPIDNRAVLILHEYPYSIRMGLEPPIFMEVEKNRDFGREKEVILSFTYDEILGLLKLARNYLDGNKGSGR